MLALNVSIPESDSLLYPVFRQSTTGKVSREYTITFILSCLDVRVTSRSPNKSGLDVIYTTSLL